MGTASFPAQERSRARREALLRAAVALLAEGGVRAVTARAVAARAGVPLAATTYYFGSVQELVDEALRMHVSDRLAELHKLIETATAGSASVEEVAERFVTGLLARDRDSTIAQFEVFLEAARNPRFQESVAGALDAFEELARSALSALGVSRAAQAASAFVAVVNGYAINTLARSQSPDTDAQALLSALRALFIAHIMNDDETARWHAHLRQPLK